MTTDRIRHPTTDDSPPSARALPPETTSEDRSLAVRRRLRRVVRSAGTLCLVAVVLPFLVFAVPQLVGADHAFVILSGSMEPQLSPGDVVVVADGPAAQVGDVITFTTGGSVPVTHRVVGIEDGQYVTKGDANENTDSAPVDPSAVLGRVVFTIPAIGHVILWANTPVGQVALVVVPLVLLGLITLQGWSRDEPPSDDAERLDDATALAAMFASVEAVPRDPTPESTVTDSGSTAAAAASDPETVVVAAADLQFTLVASAIACGYAGWNVTREFAVGAPHPVSVAVGTAGLLGVVFSAWTILDNRRARSAAGTVTVSDGGVEMEGEQ